MLLPITDLLQQTIHKEDALFQNLLQYLGQEMMKRGILKPGMNWIREKPFPDCIYIDVPQMGLSFAFDQTGPQSHELAAIHVFKDVRQYRYCDWLELPFGLSLELGIKALVMKLGEPQKKHGGREIPITITYDQLPDAPAVGLQCEFTGTLWEDTENELQSLTFFSSRITR
eukprot:Protomagalhaensia_wolfi_Nauph_80__3489@NODE_353_length_2703_cov_19_665541_g265_i0_p3_GENE_NODE_353_length_2703_cov_19_665541_g265_i0NODE_353_length_2703_cov_19_665541_g265_i0_p3_ORF_typecomplete_len171_score23_11_NODE_353_length_2703_cov_19_665541_g265_i020512563